MTIAGGIALYFIIWWTVLFAVLPFGVKSQAEAGDVASGSEPGAPSQPRLVRKALWTTLISAIVFVVIRVAVDVIGI